MEEIATPGVTSIADLAAFLDIPASKTAKAVFFMAADMTARAKSPCLVFAVLRGDMALNETKLANALACRPGIGSNCAPPGRGDSRHRRRTRVTHRPSGSPVHNVLVIVDDLLPEAPNLVAGANQPGYHLRNVNMGRDFEPDLVADIAAAEDGDALPILQRDPGGEARRRSGQHLQAGHPLHGSMGATFLMRTVKPSRSSWVPTASAWAACWPVWPRNTTTTTG